MQPLQSSTPQKPKDQPLRIEDYISQFLEPPQTYQQVVNIQTNKDPIETSKSGPSPCFPKEYVMTACVIEPEFQRENISHTIQAIFPPYQKACIWNYIPINMKKDLRYYELILGN